MSLTTNNEATFFRRLFGCNCPANSCNGQPYTKRKKILIGTIVAIVIILCVTAIVTPILVLARKTSSDPTVSTTVFTTDK